MALCAVKTSLRWTHLSALRASVFAVRVSVCAARLSVTWRACLHAVRLAALCVLNVFERSAPVRLRLFARSALELYPRDLLA